MLCSTKTATGRLQYFFEWTHVSAVGFLILQSLIWDPFSFFFVVYQIKWSNVLKHQGILFSDGLQDFKSLKANLVCL